jgi:nucleoside 2-deoxyribosyltransferase
MLKYAMKSLKRKIKSVLHWKKEKTAYLAGPMEYAQDNGLGWRLEYERDLSKLSIRSIIPNFEEKQILNGLDLPHIKKTDIDRHNQVIRAFIKQDLRFVEDVDYVIVNWNGERCSGTIGEAQHAYLCGTPAYLVTSKPFHEVPGWFLACFTKAFHSKRDLLAYLEAQE